MQVVSRDIQRKLLLGIVSFALRSLPDGVQSKFVPSTAFVFEWSLEDILLIIGVTFPLILQDKVGHFSSKEDVVSRNELDGEYLASILDMDTYCRSGLASDLDMPANTKYFEWMCVLCDRLEVLWMDRNYDDEIEYRAPSDGEVDDVDEDAKSDGEPAHE